MSLFIKNVELKTNVILAPMAGYSDFAFRKMCSDFGAGLTVTEMISSSALHYNNKKTIDLLHSLDGENPKAIQIFGHSPEIMAEAVKNPVLDKFDIIDINMGCPARKIVSNGDGSALLKDISLAKEIISACVNATSKPITVKFRIGYTDDNIVAVEFAKMCEEAGVSAITVHGRTTSQGYSGDVNYDVIRQVKESVSIPVFANGDCRSKEDLDRILEITKADGVMVGRGAIGNPEIFSELCFNEKKEVDKLSQIKKHYSLVEEFYGENYTVKYMRSHLAYYLSGQYKNTQALVKLLKMEKISEIFDYLNKIM
ncbi:MAG: tRNA dihydrouridine synthase DusB [Clostridia bacterium]|nr:tRNA dihydrouridine synthase DusB [Clostridia bacterium]